MGGEEKVVNQFWAEAPDSRLLSSNNILCAPLASISLLAGFMQEKKDVSREVEAGVVYIERITLPPSTQLSSIFSLHSSSSYLIQSIRQLYSPDNLFLRLYLAKWHFHSINVHVVLRFLSKQTRQGLGGLTNGWDLNLDFKLKICVEEY